MALLGGLVALAAAASAVPVYEDVADEVGIDFRQAGEVHPPETAWPAFPEVMGSGACWLDANGDGWMDLYVVSQRYNPENPATEGWIDTVDPRNELYVNQGDGTFEEKAAEAGVDSDAFGYGCSAADYDGDGRVDLFVANFGPDELYRNQGNLSFENVTSEAGIEGKGACGAHRCWSTSSAWGDYDGDGDLDLYVGTYVASNLTDHDRGPEGHDAQLNRLYENQGDGTFTEVAEQAGVAGQGVDVGGSKALGVLWIDHDLDGDLDLYAANDLEPNEFYENDGDGTFTDVSDETNLDDDRAGMGVTGGDFDADGDDDLFFTHHIRENHGFYENRDATKWRDRSGEDDLSTSGPEDVGWGVIFEDLDRDRDEDLFVANGHTKIISDDYQQASRVYLQEADGDGGLAWVDRSDEARADGLAERVSRGAAFSDYDQDGDTDAVLVNNANESLQLLEASNVSKSWLDVRLNQSGDNVHGIGARVNVTVDGETRTKAVRAGASYLSQNDRTLSFGLGDAEVADRVRVHWPDGNRTTVEDVEAGQVFTVDRTTRGTDNRAPTAAFDHAPETPTVGETVDFDDRSSDPEDGLVTWSWRFGDGTGSERPDPEHAYDATGTYTVTLNVTDDNATSDETTTTVRVFETRPTAAFEVEPNPVTSLDPVRFEDASSTPEDRIVERRWDLGDGTTATGTTVEHAYRRPGVYEVALTVEDEKGARDTTTRQVVVENRAPHAGIRPGQDPFVVGEPAALYDASRDPDGTVEAWRWTLGDATTSSARNPLHVYEASGLYTVRVNVTDDHGATDAAQRTVRVVDEPSAPRNLTSAYRPLDGQVALAWDPPADFGHGAIEAYRVYRNATAGERVLAGTVGNRTSFLDDAPGPGVYTYTVHAVTAAGPGPASNTSHAVAFRAPAPVDEAYRHAHAPGPAGPLEASLDPVPGLPDRPG